MHSFTAVFKETGVDPLNRFMVVGLRSANVVVLHDAKGVDLRVDNKKLEVHQVTREQGNNVLSAFYDQFIKWNLVAEDSMKAYWGAMHNSLNFGLHSRLLFVTGKVPGLTEIKAVYRGIPLTLEVAVVPHLFFTVAFKFLQHLDESGNMKVMTPWEPSDGRWLINKLNWIYGPQANITFEMVEADWVKIDKSLDQPLSEKNFLNYVVKQKNKRADLTIFFVGRWKGGEASGTYFANEQAAVVEGNPNDPVGPGADPFLVTLAHEVAHFLTFEQDSVTFHHDRPNVLLSTGLQSTKLDKQLVFQINTPW
jgi:hypothetical protein